MYPHGSFGIGRLQAPGGPFFSNPIEATVSTSRYTDPVFMFFVFVNPAYPYLDLKYVEKLAFVPSGV